MSVKTFLASFVVAFLVARGCLSETTPTSTTLETETASSVCNKSDNCSTAAHLVAHSTKASLTVNKDEKKPYDRNKEICSCNLQKYYCDINCCCDSDCERVDKNRLFGYCETDGSHFYDDRYCDYVRHVYVNNTPHEWRINQGGLFCVVKSNAPKSFIVQNKEPIKSFDDSKRHKVVNFWSTSRGESICNVFRHRQGMTYGDSIWFVHRRKGMEKFTLPKSYLTNACIYEEDVKYLKSIRSSCSIGDVNERMNFSSYFLDRKVIIRPHLFNVSDNNTFEKCPKSVCKPMNVSLCDADFKNCTSTLNRRINFNCSYRSSKNVESCTDAIEKIRYRIYHNGSDGIVDIRAFVVLRSNFTNELRQEFTVDFYWINQTANYSLTYSGNPGYVWGKSILIALKNGTRIRRNSTEFADNFLTLPGIKKGRCVENDAIEFGYNSVSKCALRINVTGTNATSTCEKIQKLIFDAWRIPYEPNTTQTVGLFGNADPFEVSDWADVLDGTNSSSLTILNTTSGNLTDNNRTVSCRRLATAIFVDVLYSRVDFAHLKDQNKILAVTREFKFENLSLPVDAETDIVLRSAVAFYDVTVEKKRRFVDPPDLQIKLPYDFFYPFVKIGNGAGPGTDHNLLVVLTFSCVFIYL